ncbi:hypothetical protein FSP39_001976 [Pinctada imbricata]|uniref:EF-hand domain-containing protein n=1 Tax=Pinctada imbricata TaxID=66713 RepID=A0AA89C2S0_PINIB|nr:hypothetical protein FSP39_001976 [Pinctada imbricata]
MSVCIFLPGGRIPFRKFPDVKQNIKFLWLLGDGTIDFEEFVKTMSNNSKSEDEYCQEFKEAFACFDKDKSGTITKQELKEVLTQLGGSPLSDEEADAMIKEADLNNDGVLNMEGMSD